MSQAADIALSIVGRHPAAGPLVASLMRASIARRRAIDRQRDQDTAGLRSRIESIRSEIDSITDRLTDLGIESTFQRLWGTDDDE